MSASVTQITVHDRGLLQIPERARTELNNPDDFQVEAMAAVGLPGALESLPEKLQKAESPNERRTVSASVCEGVFAF